MARLRIECVGGDVVHLSMRSAPGTCGAVGERAQVILVWMRALGVGNTSYPWRLGVMRIRP